MHLQKGLNKDITKLNITFRALRSSIAILAQLFLAQTANVLLARFMSFLHYLFYIIEEVERRT